LAEMIFDVRCYERFAMFPRKLVPDVSVKQSSRQGSFANYSRRACALGPPPAAGWQKRYRCRRAARRVIRAV